MAGALRERHELVGLRVGYREGPDQPALTCDLESPVREPRSWTFRPEQLGLPAGAGRAAQRFDEAVHLDAVVGSIEAAPATADLRETREALWLNLTEEHALLPAIDWEAGLARLGLPVLRLPAHITPPAPPPPRPRVALWLSSPVAKGAYPETQLVRAALDGMSAALGELPEVHVFADADIHRELAARFDGGRVTVHDPHAEGPHDPDTQPWLSWITRALGERSFDVLHLIGHGYLGADQGAFATAEAPDRNFDRRSARFVWPQHLSTMLTGTGAWGLICSAVPDNYSRAGLRLLADTTATVRAAATVVHDFATAPQGALAPVYRMLLRYPVPLPDPTPGLAIRVHPVRFGIAQSRGTYQPSRTELAELVDSGADLPGALVGAQRQIRELEAQLSFSSSADRVESARAGLEIAKARLDAFLREARDSGEIR